MISFDYLRSSSGRPTSLLVRFPVRLRKPFAACLCSLLVAAGMWLLESHRLSVATKAKEMLAERVDLQQRLLQKTRLYEERIRRLVALDDKVRAIMASGPAGARKLALLARALPPNVWITEVAPEPTGITLAGRTSGLDILSGALRALAHERELGEPELSSTSLAETSSAPVALKFSLHLNERKQ